MYISKLIIALTNLSLHLCLFNIYILLISKINHMILFCHTILLILIKFSFKKKRFFLTPTYIVQVFLVKLKLYKSINLTKCLLNKILNNYHNKINIHLYVNLIINSYLCKILMETIF